MAPLQVDSLAGREERAQQGVLQFAEEMVAIRGDGKSVDAGGTALYPNAGKKDAWKTYCEERWAMSQGSVEDQIRALPVLRRLSLDGVQTVVSAAAAVASLHEDVQDAILEDGPKRDVVKARAKAARGVKRKAEKKGKTADIAEMVTAAMKAKPSKPSKPRAPMAPAEDMQPVFDDPRDHGCKPRKLKREAVHADWRAYEALKDMALAEDDAEAILRMIDRHRRILDSIEAVASGEGQVTDEDLAELLAETS